MKKATDKKSYQIDKAFLIGIGERIRTLRTGKGLTQVELAVMMGDKDNSQVHRMESGKVNFSVSYLALIAEKLGVSPKDLLPE